MPFRFVCLICFMFFICPTLGNAQKPQQTESFDLPISKVVLYTSGVGYFQHDGTVQGDTEIQLPVQATEINDLLKSLLAQDFDSGTVSSIQYHSRKPLAKTLSTFSIDLSNHPTLGQILTQLRGEPVQLSTPTPMTGTIVGVEKKTEWKGIGSALHQKDVEYLNILVSGRLQSLALPHIQDIEVLNHTMNKELQEALDVLAQSHDRQKKTMTITFKGEGDRRVRMAYLRETPVWKTSYRLVLQDEKSPVLQGWGIVDNTTDHDWDQVQLSLVSGRPISFVMDLYQPLYAPRPIVKQELHAGLRPQTHGDSLTMETETFEHSQIGALKSLAQAKRFGERRAMRKETLMDFAAPPTSAESFDKAEMDLREGLNSTAQGQETGELFVYTIRTPVSIPRHGSAMLPILSQAVEGAKLSLYNSATHAKHPLHAFKLKNVSDLSLMQGPITVFDDNAYAGDAQMKDLAPGQERLISYALDLNTEVHRKPASSQQELVSAKLHKGVLIATRKALNTTTYSVTNRGQKPKIVLIEHPYRSDWTLVDTRAPKEQTSRMYRFGVNVDSDMTELLTVQEEQPIEETVSLITSGRDILGIYLKAKQVSSDVKTALEHVVKLRQKLSHTQEARRMLEARTSEISKDQKRIRDNMQRLTKQSQLYARYVKKLHAQETELETIQQNLDNLKNKEITQKRALEEYVMGLKIG